MKFANNFPRPRIPLGRIPQVGKFLLVDALFLGRIGYESHETVLDFQIESLRAPCFNYALVCSQIFVIIRLVPYKSAESMGGILEFTRVELKHIGADFFELR